MNYKTTLILLVLLAVVVPAAIILPKHLRPTDESQALRGRLFPDFRSSHAKRIEMVSGEARIVCEKRGDTWHMVEPVPDRADEIRITSFLSTVEFMRYKGAVREGADPAEFGLDAPHAKLAVSDGTRTYSINFGKTLDLHRSANVYVSVDGRRGIFYTDADILQDIRRDAVDFRSRFPMEIYSHRVNRVEIARAAGNIALARDDTGWLIEEPVIDKADSEQVRLLIQELIVAEKLQFIADDVDDFSPYGLHQPQISITVWSDRGQHTKTLMIGDTADDPREVYAAVAGERSVFTLDRSIMRELAPALASLRERSLTDIREDEIVSLRLTRGETLIHCEDEAFQWNMVKPKNMTANARRIRELNKLITSARIEGWVDDVDDLAPYDLDEPTLLTVTTAGGDLLELFIGGIEDEICYARIPGRSPVLKLPARVSQLAHADYLAFRTHRMLDFTRSDANRLSVAFRDGHSANVERTDAITWRATEPVEGPAEIAHVNNILWDLSSFDAEEIISEAVEDFSQFGLDTPEIIVTIGLGEEPDAQARTVLIGSAAENGYYSRIEGDNAVFVVRRSVVRNLCMSLLSLRVVSLDFNDARRIEVFRTDGLTLACERDDADAEWRYANGTQGQPDQFMVNALLDELHMLRAVDYVDYKPQDLEVYGFSEPEFIVRITLENGEELVLEVGAILPDNSAFARTESMEPVFLISRRTLSIIHRGLLPDADEEEQEE